MYISANKAKHSEDSFVKLAIHGKSSAASSSLASAPVAAVTAPVVVVKRKRTSQIGRTAKAVSAAHVWRRSDKVRPLRPKIKKDC